MDFPIPCRLAIHFDLAATGTGLDSTVNILQPHSAGAGLSNNISGSILFQGHIAAAGFCGEASADAPSLHGSAASARVHTAFHRFDANVARASADAGFIADLAHADCS